MKKEIDPRMHSAEHILSQTMIRIFDCGRPVSTHIEKKKSKCDYQVGRPLTGAEITEVERRVNAIIQEDLPVTADFLSRLEAEKRYGLGYLPEDVGGTIRIMKVGNYDACPCIGAHVNSTGELGGFVIASSSFHNGVVRIRYKLVSS